MCVCACVEGPTFSAEKRFFQKSLLFSKMLLVLEHILTGLPLLKYPDITQAEVPTAVVHGSFTEEV